MSYNVSAWTTKEIKDLLIPLKAVQELPYTEIMLADIDIVEATGLSEAFELTGNLIGDQINVIKLENYGEGSGHTWDDFKSMLRYSKGSFVAIQIWEGGDSISRLIVKDGDVKEEQVEL